MKLGRLTTLGIAIALLGVVAAFASSVVLATEDACASGGAVPDPDNNPGLVADCAALLAARDTLAGTATLNWAAETPIAEWDGVTVDGTPLRVTQLNLSRRRLTGEIPVELGDLSNLEWLVLSSNQLTGEIPTELGNLSSLERLFLGRNQVTGEIPTQLGNLSNLERLSLDGNQLTGELPQSLAGLSALESFHFYNNPSLCAPVDEAFQAWLRSIASAIGSCCATVDSVEDRAVLVELHGSMDGENWTANTNWLSDRPIREWHGVTIDASGRVNGLVLVGNGLTGELPMELVELSNLTHLILSGNQLSGEIPTELGSLSNLRELYLTVNQLTGEIPTQLGDLSNLTRLSLSRNQLTGRIPTQLGSLSNLTRLFLDRNQLTGEISTELGNIPSLTVLSLSSNQLTGEIPTELGDLSNLEYLGLYTNQLTGEIPTELGNLSNLTTLDLFSNQLTGELPQSLTGLTMLVGLYFHNNAGLCAPTDEAFQTWLQGVASVEGSCCVADSAEDRAVLVELHNATDGANWTNNTNWLSDKPMRTWHGVTTNDEGRVSELSLSENRLAGEIPTELGNLPNLTRLELNENQLAGGIPTELGNLSSLQSLDVGANELTGEIPVELTNLSSLEWLSLWGNELTGEIPTEVGNLSNLQTLDIGSNQLTGEIPSELGNSSSLEQLWLASNKLTGEIPTELGDLSNLRGLGVNDNQLTGEIPTELGSLSNLTSLRLHSNELTGEIPTELGNLSSLTRLRLHSNELTGEIPTELGNLSSLEQLWLGSNQLTGELPTELGDLTNLQSLQLNENQLTGGIPVELGGLSSLQSLDLGANQLAGEIPTELGNLSSLDFLSLWENELTGEIPTELGNLSKVQALSLAGNQLTGEIPAELGSLSSVEWLDLGLNQLTGEIPAELGSLSNLQELYLNGNRLTGEIPVELGNLSSLETLELRGNYFPGCVPEILRELIANLRSSDMSHLPACTGFDIVHDGRAGPRMYGGSLFVLPIEEELAIDDELPLRDYVARFFEYFDDEFDFLVLLSNFDRFARPSPPTRYAGQFHLVKNDVQGIGLSNYSDAEEWGSEGTLQGVPHLAYMSAISEGPLLHELMHRWGNYIVPAGIDVGAHWGFSSANGQLGGFDIADLVDHGEGRYSAGIVAPWGWRAHVKPYSPIELYLAGLMQREEVLDLWVAEDGKFVFENGRPVRADDGDPIFAASRVKTYTIEDIIAEHGERIPNHSQSQRDFRAAAILLVDEDHPLVKWQLDKVSSDISSFSYQGADENEDTYNFYEATGGRATITLGGLSQFLKDSAPASLPGVPIDLTAVGNELPGIDLSWNTPASDGLSAITAYDLRYIESAADETVDSNWTVREDVWTTDSGALQYTVTGVIAGTEYDLQVRAVNAAGDGPWSESVSGTPTTTTTSICVTEGAVGDATNTGLVSDCEALLASRDTLAGSVALNWAADTPVAQWDGVTVRGTPQRVERLDLRAMGLDGTIPGELGLLSSLTLLNLRTNQLSGSIPVELGDLTGLTYINFHSNKLTGPIPDLSDLMGLEELYLPNNMLAGPVPTWLNEMTGMRELWLWGNELSGTIPDLSGMTSLEKLKLAANDLEGGVPEASALPADLRWLIIQENPLGGTIPDLSTLTSMTVLWLHTNELTGQLPASHLPSSLTSLNLHSNQFSGAIPDLTGLDKLQWLRLQDNRLSGTIPSTLGDMDSLTRLWLHGNMLSGPIPAWLGSLTKLQRLWLNDNMLTGGIPEELGDLSNLTDLWLSGNELTGSIPSELGGLDNLKQLSLKNNQLSGDIPADLGNLADTLTHLFLAGNTGLTGCVREDLVDVARNDISDIGLDVCEPSVAEYYTQFEQVGLIQIKASDAVRPEALTAAAGIIRRMIEHRSDITERLGDSGASLAIIPTNSYITQLPEFSHLSGELDPNGNPYDSFAIRGAGGVLTQTTTATAEENLLDLPENSTRFWDEDITVHEWAHAIENIGFDDETRAEWLELFEPASVANLFPGTFGLDTEGGREFFAEMSQAFFGVDNRIKPEDFFGAGPVGTRILNALEDVYGPQPDEPLSGRIELERETLVELYNSTDGKNWSRSTNWLSDKPVGEWHGVTTDEDGRVIRFNLPSNNLDGSIPPELGNLLSLQFLVLGHNRLSSGIPPELGNLASLQLLVLGHNHLSGEIPSELGSLTNLSRLGLCTNQLSGEIPSELGSLTNLSRLNLCDNQLSGEIPSELGSLTGLKHLHIAENYITDISPLSEMTTLQQVILHTNMVSDLAPLAANTGLDSNALIDVRINPINDATRNKHIPNLQARGVTVRYSPSRHDADPPSSDPDRYIESADRNIRIEYFFEPRPGEKRRDLARAQRAVDFLVELFGNRPSEPIVYEMTGSIGGAEYKTWTKFRPEITVPFEFQSDSLQVHEVAHVFTHFLLPTDEGWFNEGISRQAEAIEFQFYGNTDCRRPQIAPALARLKGGENVFVDYPEQVGACDVHWLNVHDTGELFFMGLEDYGVSGTKVRDYLESLDRLAEGDERIGLEQVKQAAYEVVRNDISPLLDLLEPGIVFNGLVRYQEHLERVKEFFNNHPEYATPHVSWID